MTNFLYYLLFMVESSGSCDVVPHSDVEGCPLFYLLKVSRGLIREE